MRKIKPGAFPLQLDLFTFDPPAVSLPPPPVSNSLSPQSPESPQQPVLKKRAIELSNGAKIEYTFRRSKRRSIGFIVNEHGLHVTAPKWVTIKSVEEAIREKERWITGKILYFLHRAQKPETLPLQLTEGAKFPYLGKDLVLRFATGAMDKIVLDDAGSVLIIFSMHPLQQNDIKERLKHWLQEEARKILAERLPVYAARLGVTYHSFSLSSAMQRWGSCSVSGSIRLNWRLVHFPMTLIDYVIAHELAHLHEMNHSKRFWNILSTVYPDYHTARKQLNQLGAAVLSLF